MWHAVIVEPACLRFSKTHHDGRVLSNRRESLRCVGALRDIICYQLQALLTKQIENITKSFVYTFPLLLTTILLWSGV